MENANVASTIKQDLGNLWLYFETLGYILQEQSKSGIKYISYNSIQIRQKQILRHFELNKESV